MQVPKLRFKEFKLPYSKYQLSNYLIESKLRNKNLIYNKNDVLSVSGKFGVINQIELQGRSFAGEKVNNYHIVETNDIVYTKSPLKLSPYGIIKVNNGISGIVSTLYAVYHVLPNAIPKYIDFYFNYNLRLNKYLKLIVNIGAKHDMKISNEYVLTNYVSFPSIEEQTKIANFLSLIDRKIELQEKLVENLKLYKKGLLKKVFSNNHGWKSAKLGDFLIEYNKKTTINNQYPVLTSSRKGLFLQYDYFDKQIASDNNIGYNILPCNYITYRNASDDATFYFNINNIVKYGIVSPLYPVFTTQNMNVIFLQLILNYSNDFKKYCLEEQQGGTRTSMSITKLKEFKVKYPNIEEQNRIANIFSNLDKKMDFETNRLTKLKEYKKGLLQQMFI